MSAARKPRPDRRNADLARIHIARKWATTALGMSEGDYRALVGQIAEDTGATIPPGRDPSSAFLDARGRTSLLAAFAGLGWAGARDAERPAAVPVRRKGQTNGRYPVAGAKERATQKQADYIAHLEDVLDWTSDPKRLTGWIERQVSKFTFVGALTRYETTVVITGLEVLAGIKRSGSRKSADPARRWGKSAAKGRGQNEAA